MSTDKKGFFREQSDMIGDCPICEKNFRPEDVTTIKEQEEITLLHASCSQCQSAVVIGVVGSDLGVATSIGMLTDLSKEDIKRFTSTDKVSADDVLDFHKFLKEQS
jgi:hypothetical protein